MYIQSKKPIHYSNTVVTVDKKLEEYLLSILSLSPQDIKRNWLNVFINISYPKIKTYKDINIMSILENLEHFPVDIATAPLEILAKVPGMNLLSSRKLYLLRKQRMIDFGDVNLCGGKLYIAKHFICLHQRLPRISALIQNKRDKNQLDLF